MSERIEVRRNDDGTIDEVLLYVGERCVFHLEQMSKRSWYFGVYPEGSKDDPGQFYVRSKRRVTVRKGTDS